MRKIQANILNSIVCSPWIKKKVENIVIAWIVEMLTRVIARNPRATNIAIWLTLGTFTGIGFLCKYLTPLHISLYWDGQINVALAAFAAGVTAFGQTIVQPEIKGLDANGAVVKQDEAATRPFTSIVEAQTAAAISGKQKDGTDKL